MKVFTFIFITGITVCRAAMLKHSHLHKLSSFAMRVRPIQMSASENLWPVARVRSKFVEYFESKHEHINYRSSPVVPVNDPTLLFANSGMNQFKPIFVGTVDPSSPLARLTRAVNSQKCIRAGGKHNGITVLLVFVYMHCLSPCQFILLI